MQSSNEKIVCAKRDVRNFPTDIQLASSLRQESSLVVSIPAQLVCSSASILSSVRSSVDAEGCTTDTRCNSISRKRKNTRATNLQQQQQLPATNTKAAQGRPRQRVPPLQSLNATTSNLTAAACSSSSSAMLNGLRPLCYEARWPVRRQLNRLFDTCAHLYVLSTSCLQTNTGLEEIGKRLVGAKLFADSWPTLSYSSSSSSVNSSTAKHDDWNTQHTPATCAFCDHLLIVYERRRRQVEADSAVKEENTSIATTPSGRRKPNNNSSNHTSLKSSHSCCLRRIRLQRSRSLPPPTTVSMNDDNALRSSDNKPKRKQRRWSRVRKVGSTAVNSDSSTKMEVLADGGEPHCESTTSDANQKRQQRSPSATSSSDSVSVGSTHSLPTGGATTTSTEELNGSTLTCQQIDTSTVTLNSDQAVAAAPQVNRQAASRSRKRKSNLPVKAFASSICGEPPPVQPTSVIIKHEQTFQCVAAISGNATDISGFAGENKEAVEGGNGNDTNMAAVPENDDGKASITDEDDDEATTTTDTKRPGWRRLVGKATKRRKNYSPEALEKAIDAVCTGKLGTRRAAIVYGIPRSTLRNKLNKILPHMSRSSAAAADAIAAPSSSPANAADDPASGADGNEQKTKPGGESYDGNVGQLLPHNATSISASSGPKLLPSQAGNTRKRYRRPASKAKLQLQRQAETSKPGGGGGPEDERQSSSAEHNIGIGAWLSSSSSQQHSSEMMAAAAHRQMNPDTGMLGFNTTGTSVGANVRSGGDIGRILESLNNSSSGRMQGMGYSMPSAAATHHQHSGYMVNGMLQQDVVDNISRGGGGMVHNNSFCLTDHDTMPTSGLASTVFQHPQQHFQRTLGGAAATSTAAAHILQQPIAGMPSSSTTIPDWSLSWLSRYLHQPSVVGGASPMMSSSSSSIHGAHDNSHTMSAMMMRATNSNSTANMPPYMLAQQQQQQQQQGLFNTMAGGAAGPPAVSSAAAAVHNNMLFQQQQQQLSVNEWPTGGSAVAAATLWQQMMANSYHHMPHQQQVVASPIATIAGDPYGMSTVGQAMLTLARFLLSSSSSRSSNSLGTTATGSSSATDSATTPASAHYLASAMPLLLSAAMMQMHQATANTPASAMVPPTPHNGGFPSTAATPNSSGTMALAMMLASSVLQQQQQQQQQHSAAHSLAACQPQADIREKSSNTSLISSATAAAWNSSSSSAASSSNTDRVESSVAAVARSAFLTGSSNSKQHQQLLTSEAGSQSNGFVGSTRTSGVGRRRQGRHLPVKSPAASASSSSSSSSRSSSSTQDKKDSVEPSVGTQAGSSQVMSHSPPTADYNSEHDQPIDEEDDDEEEAEEQRRKRFRRSATPSPPVVAMPQDSAGPEMERDADAVSNLLRNIAC